jgi:pyruvate dehydrogenase (quinone)
MGRSPPMLDRVPDRPANATNPAASTWDQLIKAAESIVRGDSHRLNMIKEGVKSKLQEVPPGGRDH